MIQCGWACVPPVTASSAAASRRADGEAADRTAHASLIASSISRSVTLIPSGMPLDASAYPEPRHGTSQDVARRNRAEPLAPSAGEGKSRRSSGHGQSSGAVYPFWLGSARTGSFVKLTTWSGPAGQGHSHEEPYSRSCSAATPKRPLLKNRLGAFGFNAGVRVPGYRWSGRICAVCRPTALITWRVTLGGTPARSETPSMASAT